MNDDFFDEMDLPQANPFEDLEEISRQKLRLLFDVTKFELRDEIQSDKGIDINGEIKGVSNYTNFRFAIQLKATDSIQENKDGSYSWSIDTSNINYLLNQPNSAYYILYVKQQDKFLFTSINDFHKHLSKKGTDWRKQKTHTLRFKDALNAENIQKIYDQVKRKGIAQRKINEKLNSETTDVSPSKIKQVTIDANHNVYDDGEIIRLIELGGFQLLNERRWEDITTIAGRASKNAGKNNPIYSLVLGAAFYNLGRNFDALSALKDAKRNKDKLKIGLQELVVYFELATKHAIGMLSEEEYAAKSKERQDVGFIGLYKKMEEAFHADFSQEGYKHAQKVYKEVTTHSDCDDNIHLIAQSEMIWWDGMKMSNDLLHLMFSVPKNEHEAKELQDMGNQVAMAHKKWELKVKEVTQSAIEKNNPPARYQTILNSIKVTYHAEVHSCLFGYYQAFSTDDYHYVPDKQLMSELHEQLRYVIGFYDESHNVENLCVAMLMQYQILHFLERFDNAQNIAQALDSITEDHDLTHIKSELAILVDGGTHHEQFHDQLAHIFGYTIAQIKGVLEKMRELAHLDGQEIQSLVLLNHLVIGLKPGGYFQFPRNKKEKVYEIIGIEEDARAAINQWFEEKDHPPMISLALTHQESQLEIFEEMYRIRKAFFKEKFYRAYPQNKNHP